ncbi:pyridoxamine 5'-phosphate oxidase family protein [Candidatus Mycobacterium wuenschmannii]|uniref:Pyridoxamine 5'-phosphate oxidase family protein n=1 Tax=Candidatus Mycobacterium wuenschmannii TaxID=3027808 RepID=A0ABY8VYQ7_9MYCO|nr:pyridoxamine 5'-phosphate oxidase family protein [Candidatus Mycobacterium wuenschmannii]WIM88738.1 pyridoxamine 5'-phosphate oxidase family protein [Candidatus Mycobacterium wuenschmannii]
MGGKTDKKVDFVRLADALTGFHAAYLVTVDDDYRVHTVDVEPELQGHVIDVGRVGGRTRRNIEKRSAVTLLWPPREAGDYSLIVDGTAKLSDVSDADTAALRVTPARALLHRKGDPGPGGFRHDCVVFSQP